MCQLKQLVVDGEGRWGLLEGVPNMEILVSSSPTKIIPENCHKPSLVFYLKLNAGCPFSFEYKPILKFDHDKQMKKQLKIKVFQ